MAEIIVIAANKGGVGKTSLVTNLAGAIITRKPKKKILIVDMDGQGNAGVAFGINPNTLDKTVYDVLINKSSVDETKIEVINGIDLLPANQNMDVWEMEVLTNNDNKASPFSHLKNAIDPIKHLYDYILIDTPPSLGLTTGNALVATNKVIIPFVPETFAILGLTRVVETMNDFTQRVNPKLKLAGVVGTMVDQRTTLHNEMMQQARKYCFQHKLHMFETVIPRSIRFANSTAYNGKPATLTDANNNIVSAYFDLSVEVVSLND